MKLFRWKAIVPLVLVLALLVLGWTLYADRLVRKLVEFVGTEVVGATVELASARLELFQAKVTLRGLQVTNPDAPMSNLVQMGEIVAQLDLLALLEKKVVVDTVALRGVRFGTARRTSGALREPSAATGLVTNRLLDWAHSVPVPSLDLSGLGRVADFAGVSADSLTSIREARALVARADTMRGAFERDLRASDPRPTLDSARLLAARLRGANAGQLGVQGTGEALASVQRVLGQVRASRDRVTALQQQAATDFTQLQDGAAALERARQADFDYALRLIRVPSLTTPDVSMALFGEMAVARLKPVLYWLSVAEHYAPAGVKPRPDPAPPRTRMAGVNVRFPKEHTWPSFLLRHADASVTLGGENAAAGSYLAWVSGVTTEPAVYGAPLRFAMERTAAALGPRQLQVAGLLDRSRSEPHDSVDALVSGVSFPSADIKAAGARLEFPDGTVRLALDRRGEGMAGTLSLSSAAVRWVRTSPDSATVAAAPLGSKPWVEALVWRTVSSVRDVEIEVRFSGRPDAPQLEVSSNVGSAVSDALQREVGAEVAKVQAEARGRVDSIVGRQVAAARARLTALQSDLQTRLGAQQQQLQDAQAEMEQRLRDLGQVVPGVRLPSLPRIRP